jgi:hypothetical protein
MLSCLAKARLGASQATPPSSASRLSSRLRKRMPPAPDTEALSDAPLPSSDDFTTLRRARLTSGVRRSSITLLAVSRSIKVQ